MTHDYNEQAPGNEAHSTLFSEQAFERRENASRSPLRSAATCALYSTTAHRGERATMDSRWHRKYKNTDSSERTLNIDHQCNVPGYGAGNRARDC